MTIRDSRSMNHDNTSLYALALFHDERLSRRLALAIEASYQMGGMAPRP